MQILKSIVLTEGIDHIEDLPPQQFIRTIEALKDKIITEKLDGTALRFGIDDAGFFTSREGKSPKRGRFYSVDDYPSTANSNSFRAAHVALEKVEPIIRKYLKSGDTVEIEVLFGRQPNTVTYGHDGKNFIVLLRGVNGTPDERVSNLAGALKDKIVSAESEVISSPDGDKLEAKSEKSNWQFTNVAPIQAEKINTKQALEMLAELKAYMAQKNEAFPDKTNAEVAELVLTGVPKEQRGSAKAEREKVNAHIMDKFKNPIKELLLNHFVRKIKPFLQDKKLGKGEDIGVEGVVVRDPVTGSQTKIVDKDVFTAINTFNSAVRNNISGLVRTTDEKAPIEMRGGAFGQAKIKIAELLGAHELALSSAMKRYISQYKGSDEAATALNVAKHLSITSLPAVRTKISGILTGVVKEVNTILQGFKKEAGEFKLQLKTGKEIGISSEIMKRTLTAFAETKKEIAEVNSNVLHSRTAADLIMALYGKTISQIFSEGESKVKEEFELIRSADAINEADSVKREAFKKVKELQDKNPEARVSWNVVKGVATVYLGTKKVWSKPLAEAGGVGASAAGGMGSGNGAMAAGGAIGGSGYGGAFSGGHGSTGPGFSGGRGGSLGGKSSGGKEARMSDPSKYLKEPSEKEPNANPFKMLKGNKMVTKKIRNFVRPLKFPIVQKEPTERKKRVGEDAGAATTSAGAIGNFQMPVGAIGPGFAGTGSKAKLLSRIPVTKNKKKYSLISAVNEDGFAHLSDMKFAANVDVPAGNEVEFNQARNQSPIDKITPMTVDRYLNRAHEINDAVDTVTFGMEADDGSVTKIYVNASQADGFEKALADMLGRETDLEQVVNNLANRFDIVDVEWPDTLKQQVQQQPSVPQSDETPAGPVDTSTEQPTADGDDSNINLDLEPEHADDADTAGDGEINQELTLDEPEEDDEDDEIDDDDSDEDEEELKAPDDELDDNGDTESSSDEDSDNEDEDNDEDETTDDEGLERDDFGQLVDKSKKKKKKKKEETTEESVKLQEAVSFANPAAQAIADMLIAMGFDISASRAYSYQANQLIDKNSPGLLVARSTSVASKLGGAASTLAAALKVSGGGASTPAKTTTTTQTATAAPATPKSTPTFANPAIQIIANILSAIGYDLNSTHSFTVQMKSLIGHNSPGLIAAKQQSVLSKIKGARDALAAGLKSSPGASPGSASAGSLGGPDSDAGSGSGSPLAITNLSSGYSLIGSIIAETSVKI